MTKRYLVHPALIASMAARSPLIAVRADGGALPAEIKAALESFNKELTAFKSSLTEADAKALAAIEAQGGDVKQAKADAEAAVKRVDGFAASLLELEQQIAAGALNSQALPMATVGQMVVESEAYKTLALRPGETPAAGFKLRYEANTLTGQGGSPVENVDTLVPTDRRGGIVPGAFRTLRIRDLVPSVPTNSNAWQFVRENVFTNGAAETAEGEDKPEMSLTFEDMTVFIRTIAHWIKASNQILSDAPALRTYIDTRLRYGVDLREEQQIIAGNGVGQNIHGMIASGNYTAFTPTTGEQGIDTLNRAKYAIIGADYEPTGILMNPADWGAIERLKDSANGGYLVGNPFGSITPILWGLPIIASNSMTAGKFLAADFLTSYEIVSRMSTVIDVGYDGNDFTKNLVTLRAEKRTALATIRPASTRFGNLTQ